ncbi:MAG: isoleucine--tRNA ligase [Clostridiales bacterium]|jgi:isoleucyl-tRNA synthetase|nr:isoleucine--tRNA ligase [Clostridiales bacterium]
MYKKVAADMNFCEREKEILQFWKDNGIFKKTVERGEGKPEFTFYDGPPTANGKPHIGHILTRVIKDIIPRYKSMKGYNVLRKAGWDTHGLPVEIEVEKTLGLDGKSDIERYGVEPFIKKCKESVWKYKGEWERMSERVGYFMDMDDPYITYDDGYIESVWWSLKRIFDKGLIYKGHKIVPYCPRCGTALSSHEIAQGYKPVKEKSVYVKFRVKGRKNEYFLAWTTTPWTLPSNVALCVNPKEKYSKIAVGNEFYILADALIPTLFGEGEYAVIESLKGREYEYAEYEKQFDYDVGIEDGEKAYYVTCADFVTLSDGTGIVHIAPAFGQDDSEVGKAYGLPFVQAVDERGRFTDAAEDVKGMFAKDADKTLIKILKEKNLLFKELMYEHSYPFCWRCDTPILYYARSSWFIKMTEVREKLLKNNASVNWIPPAIGSGRMGNFLDEVQDWSLSRERYWGTPLPIWICGDCGSMRVVGSKAELTELSGGKDIELHKPYVDAVTFKCRCGGVFKRTKEVIDCWYDSGSMPFAQWNYPFKNKEIFEKRYPADFISEAVDQTRGWFYTLLAVSTLLFDDKPSFKNCIVLGHINDKDGVKMSKHKGNVVDPWTVLDKQGADAVRWYFYTVSPPWIPSNFYGEAVSESQRKFMGTLWNVYAFYVLYAEIDKFDPSKYDLKDCDLSLLDRWILSNLHSLIKFTDESLSEYKITESARRIQEFTDGLSNWYVRRSRERYWGSEMSEDKKSAYMTLYTVLSELAKLIAPFTPFVAEQIYDNITANFFAGAPVSVHLCDYPKCDESRIDDGLQRGMDYVLKIVELARMCRSKAAIKNRRPLPELFLKNTAEDVALGEELTELIKDEINVKRISHIVNDEKFLNYDLKPLLKVLGPKFGTKIGRVKNYLASLDAYAVVAALKNKGVFRGVMDGEAVEFTEGDLLISPINKEGFIAESDASLTVVLDANLTPELIEEGNVRELVSKLQAMRKEAGFEVTDRIKIGFKTADREYAKILAKGKICADVLADEIREGLFENGYRKVWDINGVNVEFSLEKIK